MAYEQRDYAGASVQTTLTSGISATDTSIIIDDSTGWPSGGAAGPFFVVVDRGLAGEEKIEVQSRTGTTLTVASALKRGADDTSAATHAAGASISHTFTAQDARESNAHIANTGLDHHTQYLNSARHAAVSHTQAMLASDSVGAAQIIASSVGSSELADGSVDTAAIIDDAVTTAKIADGNVVAAHMAANSVATASIIDSNVTAAKLVDDAVTAAKLADGAVATAANIADSIITFAKLANVAASTYVPSFTNVVIGGGGSYGAYWQLGRLVVGVAGFELGDSGNVTGEIICSLPTGAADMTGGVLGGTNTGAICAGRAFQSPSQRWSGLGIVTAGSPGSMSSIASAGAGNWSAATPFNWGGSSLPSSHDVLQLFFFYMST
jgi:hypothetical protein